MKYFNSLFDKFPGSLKRNNGLADKWEKPSPFPASLALAVSRFALSPRVLAGLPVEAAAPELYFLILMLFRAISWANPEKIPH